ncbi:very short patch repair endonuclease [Teredinibacter purpureus]|uniref:very short patch repair endonuclease n=1 Tax=Teredinibacter purpureus TaxID=2731756 RepID=UPI0005F83420|nr:very short patch repair endonuclease [Teredinibacter purpureus]
MSDIVSPEMRSRMMSGIKGKNTRPEMVVRKGLFRRGFRYRLHLKQLPGKPDLVLPRYHAVIFVHGCFWHRHNCRLFKWPKSNTEFWRDKITGNIQRDERHSRQLADAGWRILIVWECAIKGKKEQEVEKVLDNIEHWLLTDNNNGEISEGSVNGIGSGNL